MGLMELALIIMGVLIVIITFVLTGKEKETETDEIQDRDLAAEKEALRQQMQQVFDEQARDAQEKFETAAREQVDRYVEEKRHALEVLVNEAKEAIAESTSQAEEKMRNYVAELQEDGKIVSAEFKENIEKLADEQKTALDARSEQLVAEINHHHNDVTFLYSMMNDKEEEVKQHVKMVEELQTGVRMVEHQVKNVQMQVTALGQTASAQREEFVSGIVAGVMNQLDLSKMEGDPSSENKETVQETKESEKEELGETKVFAEGTMVPEMLEEGTREINREDVEELLEAIGQSVEEVVYEDATDLSFDAPVGDVTDELFDANPVAVAIPEAKEAENGSEAEEASGDEKGSEVEKSPEVEENYEVEDVSEETEKSKEAEEHSETTVSEDEAEVETEAETTASEDKAEVETETETKVSQNEAEADAEAEATQEETSGNSGVEDVQSAETIVEDVAEEVVNALIAEMPMKLIKAVEKSRTLSSDADMATRVKVLEMYDQGYGSMDIAETYKLGIGEVRMIIDLYSRSER